jgi:hypothetical protein
MVTKLNYPIFPERKKYKSIAWHLIRRRTEYIRSLKDKSKPTFLNIAIKETKKIPPRIDQIEFFKKCLAFFEILRKRVDYNYREFFFQIQFRNFGRVGNNFGGKKIRGLT